VQKQHDPLVPKAVRTLDEVRPGIPIGQCGQVIHRVVAELSTSFVPIADWHRGASGGPVQCVDDRRGDIRVVND
jgi:hypothetical protein